MNNVYNAVKIYSSTADSLDQRLLIRTMVGDPLNLATTDDGTTINVASGVVESDMLKVSGDATAADNIELTYDGTGYDNDFAPAQQTQVQNLSVGSSGIATTATTSVVSNGTENATTYANTSERDAVYHQVTDAAGTTDLYYEFSVGTTGIPSSVTFYGRSNGINDSINVYGYNWGGTAWEQLGTITGKTQSVDDELQFSMYNTHVGTGSDIGKVRVRFYNTGLTTANLYTDQLYVSYAVVGSVVGYANGQIWVDTVNGTSGAVTDVNGVADNPVDNWADALTISTNVGINNFNIGNGSTITLSGNSDNYTLDGSRWTLDVNGQSVAGAHVNGASVSGTCTGSNFDLHNCVIASGATYTSADGNYYNCAIAGDIVLTGAATYYFDQCYSGVAGTGTPSIDLGVGVGNTNVNFRHYSGGIEIKNMGDTGTDNFSLEGWGQYVLNANCDGGTLAVSGSFVKTDNSGNVTISEESNFEKSVLVDLAWDELLSGHAVSGSTGEGLSNASASGDPWSTALPGAYTTGQAGKIIGERIEKTIKVHR